MGMRDPTYNKEEIDANPAWGIAWILSEWYNDNAPIGWSAYLRPAESILRFIAIRGTGEQAGGE